MTHNGFKVREMLMADQVHDLRGAPISSPHDPPLSSDSVGRETEQFDEPRRDLA